MRDIIAAKIKQGRILNAFSQEKLAEGIGVSKQMISKYEAGKSTPSSGVLIKLANFLNVKIDYFFSPVIELGEINFRKKSNLSQKRVDAIKEQIKIKLFNYLEIERILEIENIFNNPISRKKISSENMEEIVVSIRNDWEIGLDPLHNIIQILEDKEVKVIEIDEKGTFDGLATIVNEKYAVIVVNKNFSIERKRFTLLHELGHLLLDIPECNKKEEEKLCNAFAGEFLFPKSAVIREFGKKRKNISLLELIEVQKKYGISIRAIIYRLQDAGIFNKNDIINFYKKLNFDEDYKNRIDKERFLTSESSERYEQLVYRALSQELISISKASTFLDKKINEILETI